MATASLLTPPAQLRDAAADLRRQAARLEEVRASVARDLSPAAFAGRWEGRVAERFGVHVDGRHRQNHLDGAHDKLATLALALERSAEANEAQIARHRTYERQVRDELARRGDLGAAGLLPTSARDTSWPRWHRWIAGGGAKPGG